MASEKPKSEREYQLDKKEEVDEVKHTTQEVLRIKRSLSSDITEELPRNVFKHSHPSSVSKSDRTTNSLSVPFWKSINYNRPAFSFHTEEISSFSILKHSTTDKQCFEDKRYLRVYKYPVQNLNVNFDLKVGETNQVDNEQDRNINSLLWWLSNHKEDIFKNDQFTFDFLSWRGVIRLIMFTLFEKNTDWILAVVKFKNAFFICEYVTDMQIKEEQNMTAEHRSFCYYGRKFEEYVTSMSNSEESVDASKQYVGVFRATFGVYRLLYGAELDCTVETESSKVEHIELKVCAGQSLNDLPFQHNRKFAKWWIQSFIVGIKKIVIGLRDNNGIAHNLAPIDISELERATRTWSRSAFFNFFSMFMECIRDNVKTEYSLDHKDVVLFQFMPKSQTINITKSSDPKYHFIPDWFYEKFH